MLPYVLLLKFSKNRDFLVYRLIAKLHPDCEEYWNPNACDEHAYYPM